MYATTKRGHIQTRIMNVYFIQNGMFYQQQFMLNRYQYHFFPLSSTLLSELKPSKLKETANPGKMLFLNVHALSQVHRAHKAPHTSAQGVLHSLPSVCFSHSFVTEQRITSLLQCIIRFNSCEIHQLYLTKLIKKVYQFFPI